MDDAIIKHHKKVIEEDASVKSSLKFLSPVFKANSPHYIWESTSTDPREVRKATIKTRMLAGVYILQYNRAVFNQTHNTLCLLCSEDEEDLPHFLVSCKHTEHIRRPQLGNILDLTSLVNIS